jgi:uncharacterized membrane protein YhaH (DUF805 family)
MAIITAKIAGTRMSWGGLWFSFNGRATRFDYFVHGVLIFLALAFIVGIIDQLLGGIGISQPP